MFRPAAPGKSLLMTDFNDDDIKTEPTEDDEDKDVAGDGEKDTGDETTEAVEDRDAGGEGEKDAGDEA